MSIPYITRAHEEVSLRLVSPSAMLQDKENKSKLIDPDCGVYKWVQQVRAILAQHQLVFTYREPMVVEIVRPSDEVDEKEKLNRAAQLHNMVVKKQLNLHYNKRSLVIRLQWIVGYDDFTHVFVAWFQEKLTEPYLQLLRRLVFFQSPMDAKFQPTESELEEFRLYQTNQLVFTDKTAKPKDWMCTVCDFLIHGRKDKCSKCGQLRPT